MFYTGSLNIGLNALKFKGKRYYVKYDEHWTDYIFIKTEPYLLLDFFLLDLSLSNLIIWLIFFFYRRMVLILEYSAMYGRVNIIQFQYIY